MNEGQQMTQTSLEERRAGLEAKLERLRMAPEAADLVRQADAAVATYREEIAALEGQMAEVDAAMGVRQKDLRAVAARERESQWNAQRQALVSEEEVRLQAVADAEKAARNLVDALNRTFAANARMAKIAHDLSTSRKVPMALSGTDLQSRMSGRLAAVMATVKGSRHRLGAIEWRGGSLYSADSSWRDDEEKRMAAAVIQPLLTQGKA